MAKPRSVWKLKSVGRAEERLSKLRSVWKLKGVGKAEERVQS